MSITLPTVAATPPAPPFNDRPVTSDGRFSNAWMRYFTRLNDWIGGKRPGAAPSAASPPTAAVEGDMWFNTGTGSLYVFHSGNWVTAISGAGPSIPP